MKIAAMKMDIRRATNNANEAITLAAQTTGILESLKMICETESGAEHDPDPSSMVKTLRKHAIDNLVAAERDLKAAQEALWDARKQLAHS
jgi:hypothetical protein